MGKLFIILVLATMGGMQAGMGMRLNPSFLKERADDEDEPKSKSQRTETEVNPSAAAASEAPSMSPIPNDTQAWPSPSHSGSGGTDIDSRDSPGSSSHHPCPGMLVSPINRDGYDDTVSPMTVPTSGFRRLEDTDRDRSCRCGNSNVPEERIAELAALGRSIAGLEEFPMLSPARQAQIAELRNLGKALLALHGEPNFPAPVAQAQASMAASAASSSVQPAASSSSQPAASSMALSLANRLGDLAAAHAHAEEPEPEPEGAPEHQSLSPGQGESDSSDSVAELPALSGQGESDAAGEPSHNAVPSSPPANAELDAAAGEALDEALKENYFLGG